MLAADQRLRDPDAFRRTVRSGRRAGGAALVVHLYVDSSADDSPEDAPAKVGFVVSKVVGSAVVRNLVKRRLRHAVKDFLSSLPLSSELVIRAQPVAATLSSAELRVELARCLQRVGVADPVAAGASS